MWRVWQLPDSNLLAMTAADVDRLVSHGLLPPIVPRQRDLHGQEAGRHDAAIVEQEAVGQSPEVRNEIAKGENESKALVLRDTVDWERENGESERFILCLVQDSNICRTLNPPIVLYT